MTPIDPKQSQLSVPASPSEVFWGEMAPCEHLVQFYEGDDVFLDALEGFATGGIEAGDAVIIIATPAHRAALERRIWARGIDIDAARRLDQYIDLDAEETLARFMVNGWPDERRFEAVVDELLFRAHGRRWTPPRQRTSGRVRAFGEMVAILWAQGHSGATVRLEHIWHRFCREKAFSLLCAYPRSGFTQDAETSIKDICAAHSKVVAG